jgi:hypothetical protein
VRASQEPVCPTFTSSGPDHAPFFTAMTTLPRAWPYQDLLPGPHLAVMAKAVQGSQGRRGQGRGLLERQVARFTRELALLGAGELGARTADFTEDLVARPEPRHVPAGRCPWARAHPPSRRRPG